MRRQKRGRGAPGESKPPGEAPKALGVDFRRIKLGGELSVALEAATAALKPVPGHPGTVRLPDVRSDVDKLVRESRELRAEYEVVLCEWAYCLGSGGASLVDTWLVLTEAAERSGAWSCSPLRFSLLHAGVYPVIRGPWAEGREAQGEDGCSQVAEGGDCEGWRDLVGVG